MVASISPYGKRLLILDGEQNGNLACFIRSSADPTCKLHVFNSSSGLRIGVWAARHILQGEEITVDYSDLYLTSPPRSVHAPAGVSNLPDELFDGVFMQGLSTSPHGSIDATIASLISSQVQAQLQSHRSEVQQQLLGLFADISKIQKIAEEFQAFQKAVLAAASGGFRAPSPAADVAADVAAPTAVADEFHWVTTPFGEKVQVMYYVMVKHKGGVFIFANPDECTRLEDDTWDPPAGRKGERQGFEWTASHCCYTRKQEAAETPPYKRARVGLAVKGLR